MTIPDIFTPEMFELCKDELTQERMTQRAAHLANLRFREYVEELVTVYATDDLNPLWTSHAFDDQTRQAYLLFQRPIEKGEG